MGALMDSLPLLIDAGFALLTALLGDIPAITDDLSGPSWEAAVLLAGTVGWRNSASWVVLCDAESLEVGMG